MAARLPDGAPRRAERRVAVAAEPRRALGSARSVGRYVEFDGHVVVVRPVAEVCRRGAFGAVPVVEVPVRMHVAEEERERVLLALRCGRGRGVLARALLLLVHGASQQSSVSGDLCAA